ncbi:MAG: hypothetical protein M3R55_06465 [Acidobacteriota bacterium]|nr:hypothetical protein [Acidobacteriota bacterium]
MGGRLQPALLGGLFIGVLSTLPFVNIGNACCCLWVILGGMLAANLLQKNQAEPINAADGLLVGLMAGVVGAFIGTVLSIPIQMMFGPVMRRSFERFMEGRDMPPEFLEMMSRLDGSVTASAVVVTLITSLIAYVIFGMLGGVLGVAIFRRKEPKIED